jgi:hypothetical protein
LGKKNRSPQDPHMDGTGLRFEDNGARQRISRPMPQAIKLIDGEGRSCIYVPMTQNGKGGRQPRVYVRSRR